MQYRQLGNTGMSASIIGLGSEFLDKKPYEAVESTMHAALDHGINIMDLFMPGEEVRRHIGRALRGRRDKMIIQGHIGSTDINEQYDVSRDLGTCKRYFEDLMRFLETDYIDCGMLFFMDSDESLEKIEQNGILDYARDLKRQGTIRAIGASSHNPRIAAKMVEKGMIDMLMFSINAAFDMTSSRKDVLETLGDGFSAQTFETGLDPERMALYRLCERNGVGITVMKSLGAGKLLSAEHTPFSRPMTVGQCVHYVLTRPAVTSALVGCQSPEHVADAVRYLELSDTEKDYTDIVNESRGSAMSGSCVYCNHCQPCPVEIDIAGVNKYLDIALLDPDNIPPSVRQHYASLQAAGSDCISCGSCEERCPFSVPVIERMAQAARLLE